MSRPTLEELPPPPRGRGGWPWTEGSPRLATTMPDGRPWPRISIVTPSYNQGQFLEETIRSVLLQGYPDLEYVVMDGGSNDGSTAILEKYSPWLTHWQSQRDGGQANALNRGFARCSGVIAAWVNSDDLYFESVFRRVAEHWFRRSDRPFWLAAAVAFFGEDRSRAEIGHQPALADAAALAGLDTSLHAAGVFWDRSFIETAGPFREELHYSFDKDFWLRLLINGHRPELDSSLVAAAYRFHANSKSVSARLGFRFESARVALDHARAARLGPQATRVLRDQIVYAATRIAQDVTQPRRQRAWTLLESLRHEPAAFLRSDWRGGARALLRRRT